MLRRATHQIIFLKGGTESIQFNDFKRSRKLKLRPMGVEPSSMYLIFMYNTFKVFTPLLYELYNNNNKSINNILMTSNSPILEDGRIFSNDTYGTEEITYMHQHKNEISTVNGNFRTNLVKDSLMEDRYPYYMTLDIQSFFPSIYTHNFSRMIVSKLYKTLKNNDKLSHKYRDMINSYFKFLDVYNMQCNRDETRGIISGPLSSKISSELLSLSIYYEAENNKSFKNINVVYSRYVDDVVVFAKDSTTLNNFYYKLGKLLQNYGLTFQDEKVNLKKGIYIPKSAHLWPLINKIPFLYRSARNSSPILILNKINDFLDFKVCIKDLINNSEFSTLKALFTRLGQKRIVFKDINRTYKKDSFEKIFYEFLLKLVKMCPYLSVKIYTLIRNQITFNKEEYILYHKNSLTKDNFDYDYIIFKELVNSLKDVNDRFSDSVIQIWTYYLINTILDKFVKYNSQITHNYDFNVKKAKLLATVIPNKSRKDDKDDPDTNPLVLMSFISTNNSEKLNNIIYKIIRLEYSFDINKYKLNRVGIKSHKKSKPSECDTIMNSKWAWPMYELHSICHIKDDSFMGKVFDKKKLPYIFSYILSGLYKE